MVLRWVRDTVRKKMRLEDTVGRKLQLANAKEEAGRLTARKISKTLLAAPEWEETHWRADYTGSNLARTRWAANPL